LTDNRPGESKRNGKATALNAIMILLLLLSASFRGAGILPGPVDAAKVQALLDAGGEILIEQGEYRIDRPLVIPKGINLKLRGETKLGAVLRCVHKGDLLSNHGFVELSSLTLITDDDTGNCAFASHSSNNGMVFRDLYIRGFRIGMLLDGAVGAEINGCRFARNNVGLILENAGIPDAGNNRVTHCAFGGQQTARAGILQRDGGGLIVADCSFLGHQFGVQLRIRASTSVIRIRGCGFEVQSVRNIDLEMRPDKPGESFHLVQIDGNELSTAEKGAVRIYGIHGVLVQNNILNLTANQTAFTFEKCTRVWCNDNHIYCHTGGKGTALKVTDCNRVGGVNNEAW